MNADERTRRALALFDELIDLAPATREAALQRVQLEDAALGAEVRALLDADSAEGLLEQPLQALVPGDDELLPQRIGPWAVTGVAGRGGMGAVYLGERDDGQFHQQAAIKLIRLGMDTPQLRARFLRERQILAKLTHPHIATLLDGGVTDTGAPWFAMERVDGQPIDAWCDAQRLTVRARVELFLQVCAAVLHAHQHLIIHRDLKPSNILIDREGRAKLLDFGIAKLLDTGALEAATAERPHTPDFAAPEQLAGGAITTATDVYGLGVVLHLVLSGVRPEPGRALAAAGGRASPAQLDARGVGSARQLARLLQGDLSAIVGKCLEVEPGRRYATVNGLAEDLRAWLQGAPVRAQPPTRGYLLRRFVRRNRWGVAAAAMVALAVAVGVGGVVWQAGKARRAAEEAQAQLEYLNSLLTVLAPSTAEARDLDRARLLRAAAQRARVELAKEPASLAGVQLALARVAMNVGEYALAMELADAAVAGRTALSGVDSLPTAEAQAVAGLVRIELSPPRLDEAAALLDAALATVRARAPGSAQLVDVLRRRSTAYGVQDQLTEQQKVIGEAAGLCEGPLSTDVACESVWLDQGAIANRSREPLKALPLLQRAYEARKRRLGADHAETLQLAASLAWAMSDADHLADALRLAEQTHAANQRIYSQPTEASLRAELILSRLVKRTGDFTRAEALVNDYVTASRKVFGDTNSNTILGFSDHASLLFSLGRFDEAAEQFELATRGYEAVKSDVNAAITRGYAGDSRREAGHASQALGPQREAIAVMREKYPHGQSVMLARALSNLGMTELDTGLLDESLAHHDEGLAMLEALKQPAVQLLFPRGQRARTLFALGRHDEAERELRATVTALTPSKADLLNQYWETFALLTIVACANHAADCEALRAEARPALELSLNALTRKRLAAALPK